MTIVSTTDFRANMTKYFDLANSGEHVQVRSRSGDFQLKPLKTKTSKPRRKKRDATAIICRGMKEWKHYLETGESDYFQPAEKLLDELPDSDE